MSVANVSWADGPIQPRRIAVDTKKIADAMTIVIPLIRSHRSAPPRPANSGVSSSGIEGSGGGGGLGGMDAPVGGGEPTGGGGGGGGASLT